MGGIHENKLHGQATFPYMVYRGKLPEYIRCTGMRKWNWSQSCRGKGT